MTMILLPKIFIRSKNKNIKEKCEQKNNKTINEFKIYQFNGQVKEINQNVKNFGIGLANGDEKLIFVNIVDKNDVVEMDFNKFIVKREKPLHISSSSFFQLL